MGNRCSIQQSEESNCWLEQSPENRLYRLLRSFWATLYDHIHMLVYMKSLKTKAALAEPNIIQSTFTIPAIEMNCNRTKPAECRRCVSWVCEARYWRWWPHRSWPLPWAQSVSSASPSGSSYRHPSFPQCRSIEGGGGEEVSFSITISMLTSSEDHTVSMLHRSFCL